MSEREAAVGTLADSLKRRYGQRGFLIHPSLTFVDTAAGGGSGGGIEARVTSALPRDEILLVVPESACLTATTIAFAAGSDEDHADGQTKKANRGQEIIVPYSSSDGGDGRKRHRQGGGVRLSELLSKVEKQYHRMMMVASEEHERGGRTNHGGNNLAIYDGPDVAMAVCVMYAAANPGWWSEQVATWPSREAIRDMPLYWDDLGAAGDRVMDILGEKTAVREQIDGHQEALRIGFERVVLPLLSDVWEHFVPPNVQNGETPKSRHSGSIENDLWESYRYAFTISYTRCHDGIGTPGLIPLVDLFNGLPDLCADGDAGINVKIATGFWPFIRGDKFVNECNLPCSSVYATRDLKEGESLFISYGDLSPCNFLSKYGTVPRQLLHHPHMADTVYIWLPPDLLPDPKDGPRIQALRNAGYPVTAEEYDVNCITTLDGEDYEAYHRGGMELQGVGSLRQFLILTHLADDSAVRLNVSTGRLRCSNLSSFDLCRILVRVIDYSLERLSAEEENSTSANDVKRANDPQSQPSEAAALLSRVGQRETLAKWRHAFCRKYRLPSHADATTNQGMGIIFECPPCLSGGACQICGRTFPSLKCSRCKLVCYCSREHQRSDWKVHKRVCRVPS